MKNLLNPLHLFRILRNNHFLLFQLIRRNIEQRYRGTLLGFIWSFVQPLLMLAVYTFVFSCVFEAKWGISTGENKTAFSIIMFAGIATYNLFSESLLMCSTSILNNPNYVKKVVFPLELIPIAVVSSSFLVGLVWFLMLFIGSVIFIGSLSWTMFFLPLLLIPLYILTSGFGFFVASFGVYVRDLPYILGVILQILFFMTPIFYPITAVPKQFRIPLESNPMSMIIEQVRAVFLYKQVPNWTLLLIIWCVSIFVFYLGYLWFVKTKKGFADVL